MIDFWYQNYLVLSSFICFCRLSGSISSEDSRMLHILFLLYCLLYKITLLNFKINSFCVIVLQIFAGMVGLYFSNDWCSNCNSEILKPGHKWGYKDTVCHTESDLHTHSSSTTCINYIACLCLQKPLSQWPCHCHQWQKEKATKEVARSQIQKPWVQRDWKLLEVCEPG